MDVDAPGCSWVAFEEGAGGSFEVYFDEGVGSFGVNSRSGGGQANLSFESLLVNRNNSCLKDGFNK